MPKDPLPPNDVDAERAVLGSILLDGSTEIVRQARTIIAPEDFYSEKLGVAFEGACALAKTGTSIDIVTLMSWLEANRPGMVSAADLSRFIVDTPTASHMVYYARIVFETSTRRQLINALADGVRAAYSIPDGAEALRTADVLLADLHASRAKAEAADLNSIAEISMAGRGKSWTWGFDELDDWTGGLYRGDFHVISGYTSTGKTHLGVAITWAAACAGARVGYFSLEVGKRDLFWRLAGHVANIDWRGLMASTSPESPFVYERKEAVDMLRGMKNLWLFDQQRKVGQIVLQTVAHELDIAIIDYGQLVAASERGAGMYEQNAGAAYAIQGMAKTVPVGVVCFSQISNAGARLKGEHGGIINAKGAGEWGSAPTAFIAMERDAWAVDLRAQALVTFSVMKSQIGPSGCEFSRYLDVKTSRFRKEWDDTGQIAAASKTIEGEKKWWL